MDNHCGAEGDRTPDLMVANHALSQLSYSPVAPVISLLVISNGRDAKLLAEPSAQHPNWCGPE
jgi:hypothetical protein